MSKDELAPDDGDVEQDHLEVDEDTGESGTDENQTTRETDGVAGDDGSDGDDLEKTDKERLKNTRDELLRVNQEKADMARKVDELSGKLDGVIQMTQQKAEENDEPNPFAFLDDEETLNDLYSDPKNMQKILKQIVGYFGQTLSARDKALIGEIDSRVKMVDPERRALAEKVAELKQDADYAQFSDDVLIVIAKKEAEKAKTDGNDDSSGGKDGFRGSVGGGGGRRVVKSKKSENPEVDRLYNMLKRDDEQS